jgi:L-rhamnose mutarotase
MMKLKPGCAAEYQRRHDTIWPDLLRALTDAGIVDYSIYLDEPTLTLFAFQKIVDGDSVAALPSLEIVRRWWAQNVDVMETHPDHTPVCIPLKEVFHMD